MHSIHTLSMPISLCPPLRSRTPLTHKSSEPRTLDHYSPWMVRQLQGGGGGCKQIQQVRATHLGTKRLATPLHPP